MPVLKRENELEHAVCTKEIVLFFFNLTTIGFNKVVLRGSIEKKYYVVAFRDLRSDTDRVFTIFRWRFSLIILLQ